MPEENSNEPIGPAVPLEPPKEGLTVKGMIKISLMTAAGIWVFAGFLLPTRLSGASRSMKLRWQERHNEMQKALAAADASQRVSDSKSASTQCSE